MPGCVLRYCTNNSKHVRPGITFHRFPRRNNQNMEKWIKFVQKNRSEANWLPSNYSCICSLHFREEDKYATKNGRCFLKNSAVPYDPKSNDDHGTMNLKSESVSDSETISETPREILLKEKLRHSTLVKKKLTVKIKKIQRQNRNLEKKCESLTNLVKTLKKHIASLKKGDIMEEGSKEEGRQEEGRNEEGSKVVGISSIFFNDAESNLTIKTEVVEVEVNSRDAYEEK